MDTPIFIGVDGGASKCLVRIEDVAGSVLGEVAVGPASIKHSVAESWRVINQGIDAIVTPLGLNLARGAHAVHVGIGIAGTELPSQCDAFLKTPHAFQSVVLASDAHIACLGAHRGADGAVIAIGTGVIGWQIESGHSTRVSGFGFPHDDQGGGAWLGFEAVREALQCYDGRKPHSRLAEIICQSFADQSIDFIAWANSASSTDYAKLTPLILQAAAEQDAAAIALFTQAAQAIHHVARALQAKATRPLPLSLVGGLSESILAYLPAELVSIIQPPKGNAAQGAVCMARNKFNAAVAERRE